MITRDQRFRLLDEYSLQIKGVRPQDAGDYICEFLKWLVASDIFIRIIPPLQAKLVIKKTET